MFVRVEESAHALAGGAAIIDVKEPQLGSLGRADDAVIAEILHFVAGRRPVSAALGELLEDSLPYAQPGLSFVKSGLAGCGRIPIWPSLLAQIRLNHRLLPVNLFMSPMPIGNVPRPPPWHDVVDLACRTPGSVVLLDTCCKTSSAQAPDHAQLAGLAAGCGSDPSVSALPGGPGSRRPGRLTRPGRNSPAAPARPDWFAVRGAVCLEGRRNGAIQEGRVRELVNLLR